MIVGNIVNLGGEERSGIHPIEINAAGPAHQDPDKANQIKAGYSGIVNKIGDELVRAAPWGDFHSAHDAYAHILEEMDELWEHVKTKQKNRDLPAMEAEAIQVAAMAMKFVRMMQLGRGRV